MSDYPMLISNKLHSFRNFRGQSYEYYHYNRQESEKLIREADIFFVANRQYITDFQ